LPIIGTTTTQLQFYNDLEADYGEIFAGGQRYAMVELPDSMVDTTLFVGNLCEFVTDDMLSNLFQQASSLKFVPACVARKPNMSSLKYGFVTFPTIAEKENAIIKFTGYELNNKKMKVEEIHDYKYRVRVPEKLVVYAVGEIKQTREGGKNTMRKVTNSREPDPSTISLSSSSYSMSHAATSKNRKKKRRTQSSSSSMSNSLGERGGYKNMKRKQKRKQRRRKNGDWDDFGLSY
jgi:RNA recognition motif-containing protein